MHIAQSSQVIAGIYSSHHGWLLRWLRGQLDESIPPELYFGGITQRLHAALLDDPNFSLIATPAALHRQIWMRTDTGQFADKRVRHLQRGVWGQSAPVLD